jgi:hypothetical protein
VAPIGLTAEKLRWSSDLSVQPFQLEKAAIVNTSKIGLLLLTVVLVAPIKLAGPATADTSNPPVAADDNYSFYPNHTYKMTDRLLRNDSANCDGGSFGIHSFTQPDNQFVITSRKDGELRLEISAPAMDATFTFTYVDRCVDPSGTVDSNTATVTVLAKHIYPLVVRHASGKRLRWQNDNEVSIKVVMRNHFTQHLDKKFVMAPHTKRTTKRFHLPENYLARLLPLGIIFADDTI